MGVIMITSMMGIKIILINLITGMLYGYTDDNRYHYILWGFALTMPYMFLFPNISGVLFFIAGSSAIGIMAGYITKMINYYGRLIFYRKSK